MIIHRTRQKVLAGLAVFALAAACVPPPVDDEDPALNELGDAPAVTTIRDAGTADAAGFAMPKPVMPAMSAKPVDPPKIADAGCDGSPSCAKPTMNPPANLCPAGSACPAGACGVKGCTSWGGAFEQVVGGGCLSPNGFTGSCTCAPGFEPIPITTIDFPSVAVLSVCIPPKMAPNADFGGVFQRDEPVDGGLGCRQKNPYTADCTCPPGSTEFKYRTLVTTASGAPIPSFFFLCFSDAGSTTAGGAFQLDDDQKCRHVNPITNACTCPPSFDTSNARVFDDGQMPGGNAGSTIGICNPPP